MAYYGPNIDDPSPLRELYQQLLETKYIILGGDFNTLLDPVLDKSTPRPAVNSPKMGDFVHYLIKNVAVVDIWGMKAGQERGYTFQNKKLDHSSRIDIFSD